MNSGLSETVHCDDFDGDFKTYKKRDEEDEEERVGRRREATSVFL